MAHQQNKKNKKNKQRKGKENKENVEPTRGGPRNKVRGRIQNIYTNFESHGYNT